MDAEGPRKRPFCLERFGPEANPSPRPPLLRKGGVWSSTAAYGALLITAQARRAPALPVGWVL